MRRVLLLLAAGFAGATLPLFAPEPAVAAGCHPSYSNVCLPDDRDVDCSEITGAPVKVVGPDVYRLDRDKDGLGCETDEGEPQPDPSESSSAPASPTNPAGFTPDGSCTEAQAGLDASQGGKLYACQRDTDGTYRWLLITANGEDGGNLPKTGFNANYAMAAGALLLGVGGAVLWFVRGRRYHFEV